MNPGKDARNPKGIRAWPAVAIVGLGIVLIGWEWGAREAPRQAKNLFTLSVGLISFVLLCLWWSFFSRISRRIRLTAGIAVFAGLVLALGLVRVRGVTGDLIPVFEFRWRHPPVTKSGREEGVRREEASSPLKSEANETAADYPQFLGPRRDATVRGVSLETDWARHPPRMVWRHEILPAWTGFTVSGPFAVTQEQDGPMEIISCYRVTTGERLWDLAYEARYSSTLAGEGPRANPTLAGDSVYTMGATGILRRTRLRDGEPVWVRHVLEDAGGRMLEWGISCSPLFYRNMIIVSAGGDAGRSVMAYSAADGTLLWGGGSAPAGYSSPIVGTLLGSPQLILFNAKGVTGHSLDDGHVLWNYPWGVGHPHVAVPVIVSGDEFLISSGYGVGCAKLRLERTSRGAFRVSPVWKTMGLKAKFTNVVYRDGFIYGLDDGIMVCLDLRDGRRRWKEGRYGHGQVILVDNALLVMAESGEVALIDPSPEAYHEFGRFRALEDKTWNPPALAVPFLLVRNDQEAACYRLALETRPVSSSDRR